MTYRTCTHTHTHTREEDSIELKDRMNLDLRNFTQKEERTFFGGKKKSLLENKMEVLKINLLLL